MCMEEKNIFEIVEEKELNFVLSSKIREDVPQRFKLNEVAVFIHLYYEDSVEGCLTYVKNVPVGINVFISVSSEQMKRKLENYLQKWNLQFCRIVMKQNRGRDLSALLVAFREKVCQYKYICFVHDKKEKYQKLSADTQMWIRSMWDNTLLSEAYIYNVLDLLVKNKRLGLLVPPEMAGKRLNHAYVDTWKANYENTVDLARELKLDCNISKKYPSVTLGTVFWCKSAALEKLLAREWKYEDFHEEPLPWDGTVSHAIERILGYVAQDAGFETGYVMSDKFAQSYILQLKKTLRATYVNLKEWEINSFADLVRQRYLERNLVPFMEKFQRVYFYGTGCIGEKCFRIAEEENRKPHGFLVSRREGGREFLGLPVYELDEVEFNEKLGIVVAVGERYEREIVDLLDKMGVTNYMTINSLEEKYV